MCLYVHSQVIVLCSDRKVTNNKWSLKFKKQGQSLALCIFCLTASETLRWCGWIVKRDQEVTVLNLVFCSSCLPPPPPPPPPSTPFPMSQGSGWTEFGRWLHFVEMRNSSTSQTLLASLVVHKLSHSWTSSKKGTVRILGLGNYCPCLMQFPEIWSTAIQGRNTFSKEEKSPIFLFWWFYYYYFVQIVCLHSKTRQMILLAISTIFTSKFWARMKN